LKYRQQRIKKEDDDVIFIYLLLRQMAAIQTVKYTAIQKLKKT